MTTVDRASEKQPRRPACYPSVIGLPRDVVARLLVDMRSECDLALSHRRGPSTFGEADGFLSALFDFKPLVLATKRLSGLDLLDWRVHFFFGKHQGRPYP